MSKGLKVILNILDEKSIVVEQEKTFEGLKFKRALRLDVYFIYSGKRYAIEYDGKDHFSPRYKSKNCSKECDTQCLRDRAKDKYCINNQINMLRIAYTKDKFIRVIVEEFIKNKQKSTFAWYADKKIYQTRNVKIKNSLTIDKVEVGVVTTSSLIGTVWSTFKTVVSFPFRLIW